MGIKDWTVTLNPGAFYVWEKLVGRSEFQFNVHYGIGEKMVTEEMGYSELIVGAQSEIKVKSAPIVSQMQEVVGTNRNNP